MAERGGSIDALRKAVEFAHYLAKDAEELLEAVNERDALLVKIEEGEEIDEATLQQANEAVLEFTRGLRSGIHEFRRGPTALRQMQTQAPRRRPRQPQWLPRRRSHQPRPVCARCPTTSRRPSKARGS